MQMIVFRLSDLYYAAFTEQIEEITTALPATNVPQSPPWVEGLVNLRGDVLTLVNLYNLLKIDDINKEDCYNNTIVAQLSENSIALMVDEVIGITDVTESDFQPTTDAEDATVHSLVTVYDRIVNVLDLNNLFEEKEE